MASTKKKCTCCGEEKGLDEFQARAASKDGRTAACRACLQARDRARYPAERDKRASQMARYVATDRGREISNAAKRRHNERHPAARNARAAVCNAVRDGRLVKQPCHICGTADVEAHHPDYSRKLDVVWLCILHHEQLHTEHAAHLRTIESPQ